MPTWLVLVTRGSRHCWSSQDQVFCSWGEASSGRSVFLTGGVCGWTVWEDCSSERPRGCLWRNLCIIGVLVSGPAGGGCDLLQLLWYSGRVLGESVLGLGTVWNGGILLSSYTMWGSKVCTVNLSDLFMDWIGLALQYFIDIIDMLLALSHVWKIPGRLDSQWRCI